ncbi:hypothetical protein D9M69_694850 [compost metagenome]
MRKPQSQAPRVARIGSQTIFIRLALTATLPLERRDARDSVPPMQISARGRVICAKYSPEVSIQAGNGTCQ